MGWLTGSNDSGGANGTFDGSAGDDSEQDSDGLTDVYFGGSGSPIDRATVTL